MPTDKSRYPAADRGSYDNVGLFDADSEIIAHILDRRAVALNKAAGENCGYFHLVIENAVYAKVNAEQLSGLDHIIAHGVSVDLAYGRVGIKYALRAVVNAYGLLARYAGRTDLRPPEKPANSCGSTLPI